MDLGVWSLSLLVLTSCGGYSAKAYKAFSEGDRFYLKGDYDNARKQFEVFLTESKGEIIGAQGGGSSENYLKPTIPIRCK